MLVEIPVHLRKAFSTYRLKCVEAFDKDMSISYNFLGGALGNPSGSVAYDLGLLEKLFGADLCLATSMGSTLMNKVLLYYVKRKYPGQPLLVTANMHKSIIDAACICGVPLRFVPVEVDPLFESVIPPSPSTILEHLNHHSNAAALLITSPTYEGLGADIKNVIISVRESYPNIPIFIDNAWGWGLKTPLHDDADIVVRSSHKMDGAKQGGSILLASRKHVDLKLLSECATACLSTSQSYPVILSIFEIYMGIWATCGDQFARCLIEWSNRFKSKLHAGGLQVLDELYLRTFFNNGNIRSLDPRKVTVSLGSTSGFGFSRKLQEAPNGLIPEKAGFNTLTFISTGRALTTDPCTAAETVLFYKPYAPLLNRQMNIPLPLNNWESLQKTEAHEAIMQRSIMTPIQWAIDKVSAETITPYPPGIPVIIPGQVVTREVSEYLQHLADLGAEIIAADPKMDSIRVVA